MNLQGEIEAINTQTYNLMIPLSEQKIGNTSAIETARTIKNKKLYLLTISLNQIGDNHIKKISQVIATTKPINVNLFITLSELIYDSS